MAMQVNLGGGMGGMGGGVSVGVSYNIPTTYQRQTYQYHGAYDRMQPYTPPMGVDPAMGAQFMQASAVFRQFDRDNSGRMGKHEFHAAVNALGYMMNEHDAKRLIEVVDIDKSGKLDEREFCEWFVYYRRQQPPQPPPNLQPGQAYCPQSYQRQQYNYGGQQYNPMVPYTPPLGVDPQISGQMMQASAVFRQYDTDHSGRMGKREFHQAMNSLGHFMHEQDSDRVLATADTDRSGKLEEREFCEFYVFYRNTLPAPGQPGAPAYANPAYGQPNPAYGQQMGQPMGQPGMGQPGMGQQPHHHHGGGGVQVNLTMGAPGMM